MLLTSLDLTELSTPGLGFSHRLFGGVPAYTYLSLVLQRDKLTTTSSYGGPSQTLQAPQTATAAGPAAQDGLTIGAEVGSILGAIFRALALAVAVYFGRKQYKLRS